MTTTSTDTCTLHITFKRAHSLPVADLLTLSSDPFIIATLRFPHSSSPKLHHRTPTIRRTTAPEWSDTWVVANVPTSGVRLKIKVEDEDENNSDDRLGVTYVETGALQAGTKREYKLGLSLRKAGDKWVILTRFLTVGCLQGQWKNWGGFIEVDVKVEEGKETENANRPYTLGPNWWTLHFSPLIGIITRTRSPGESTVSFNNVDEHSDHGGSSNNTKSSREGRVQRYQFTATKIQLTGPVPSELDVRYVAFRPLIKTFYTKSGIRGRLLNRALKHQYRTIYSYDRKTEYGISDHSQLARKFLDITSWGQGGRVYTYVITLDGEWRFTETGEEFGIQMLSKHTMHSCVSIYVAFAGEFFVRAKKRPHRRHQPHRNHSGTVHSHEHEPEERSGREGHIDDFELVIDNDSGTYRPDKELLPSLQRFLERNLEGLTISARHCYDEDHMAEKKEHAKAKERRGRARYKQPSSSRSSSSSEGSIDSSDEEELTSGKLGIGRRMRQRMMLELEEDDEVVLDPAHGEGSSNWKGKEQDIKPAENKDRR